LYNFFHISIKESLPIGVGILLLAIQDQRPPPAIRVKSLIVCVGRDVRSFGLLESAGPFGPFFVVK